MLNVLYLPIGKQPGTERAFINAGVNLMVYDFFTASQSRPAKQVCEEFLNHVREHKPDLIHMQLQMTNVIDVNTIRMARQIIPGVIITNWTGDIRKIPDKNFLTMSHNVDYSLMSHVGQIDMYKRHECKNPRYWQIGYDPECFFPQERTSFKYDVSFAGNAYPINTFPDSKLRVDIVSDLKSRFGDKFGLFGSGYRGGLRTQEAPISAMNNIYNDSCCVLSVSHFNDVSHYFSDRLLMCLASGRPTIIYRFPGYKSYFANGRDVLVANSIKEVVDLVQWCKDNPDKANEIGKNGFAKVNSEHSFTSRILELLNMLNLTHKI